MLDFYELMYSPAGKAIISIVWGLGLAAIFKNVCKGRDCQIIQYKGPDPEEIKKYSYKYGNDSCYTYTPYLSKCE